MTMSHYDWSIHKGTPVLIKNGTFCVRDGYTCSTDPSFCQPMSTEDLECIFADGGHFLIYTINNQLPGPNIIVYEHQEVKVRVTNHLVNEGVTIHWHGMHQVNTPWMDGVPMISQCPISPGQSFTYRFNAYPAGTHWYHSHVGAQRSNGLSGALIVLPLQKRADLVPLQNDFIFQVQDWMKFKMWKELVKIQDWFMVRYAESYDDGGCFLSTPTYDGSFLGFMPFDAALINGKGQSVDEKVTPTDSKNLLVEIFNVTGEKHYRFRIINTAALMPFRISIDHHSMEVVSSDGSDVEKQEAQSLIVFPGERFDVIVFTDAQPDNYWIRAQTIDVYDGNVVPRTEMLGVLGVLHYNEANNERPVSRQQDCKGSEMCTVVNCPFTTTSISALEPSSKCVSLAELKSTKQKLDQHPVPMPRDDTDFEELFLNFHFLYDAFGMQRPAVNEFYFKMPSSPLQLYPDITKSITDCSTLKTGESPICTHVIKLQKNKVVQIVLTANDGDVSGFAHPIHLHGTSFHVLKYGFSSYDNVTGFTTDYNRDLVYSERFIKQEWRNSSWNGGNVPGSNLQNPPLKDTVIIPRQGYVVIRFRADNPGYWFMHCHFDDHQMLGMALVLQVGERDEMPSTPTGIPKCGNFEWNQNQEFNELSILDSHAECATDDTFVSIHRIWIISAGFLSMGLLCACIGFGLYIVCHRQKHGTYQYIKIRKYSKSSSDDEKSKLLE